jgi:His/Glu/Gln/Arg/opine family amino acid ABC transporter permease subunit
MDKSFARTDMLPALPPPVTERGIVKWARENLFSSPLNIVLTVVGVIIIWWLVASSLPWWLNSVWTAESLGQCREIVIAKAGEGATGACWAMIRERWHQFIFGHQYPPSEWWRPVAAFGLLFAALSPVLFSGQKRNLGIILGVVAAFLLLTLWLAATPTTALVAIVVLVGALVAASQLRPGLLFGFTALYPALCFWLLWGGSVWLPLLVLVSAVVGWLGWKLYQLPLHQVVRLAFGLIVGLAVGWIVHLVGQFINTVTSDFLDALTVTGPSGQVFADYGPLFGLMAWLGQAVLALLGLLLIAALWVLYPLSWVAIWIGAALAVVLVMLAAHKGEAIVGLLGALVAGFGFLVYGAPYIAGLIDGVLPLALTEVTSDKFGGFLLAIVIGVAGISFSLPIGILLALGRQSDMLVVKTLSVGFIEFIRGVPLITLLFTASLLLQYFLPPGTNFDIILRVIILVTFFAAAYLAEVIRGGLAALPRGQYEAADALGLTYWQAQRLIILPQALKVSIPAIVSTFIGLFKDTTLVSFVALYDPLRGITGIVRADIDWKGIYWEPYIFVGVIFFLICFGMSRYSMYLEQKLKTDHR